MPLLWQVVPCASTPSTHPRVPVHEREDRMGRRSSGRPALDGRRGAPRDQSAVEAAGHPAQRRRTHRDLKPDNVYFRDGKLGLGDFGIMKMNLDPKHSFASAFAPDFAPNEVLLNYRWGQADDVYQVGLLAATLLGGEVWWTDTVSVKAIAALPASDAFKSWIWHATGTRAKRYLDAADAIDALDALRAIDIKPGRAPRSLDGRTLVFTGRLDGLTRPAAAGWPESREQRPPPYRQHLHPRSGQQRGRQGGARRASSSSAHETPPPGTGHPHPSRNTVQAARKQSRLRGPVPACLGRGMLASGGAR